jgi:hypothetical protein
MTKRILIHTLVIGLILFVPIFVLHAQETKKPNWQERMNTKRGQQPGRLVFIKENLPAYIRQIFEKVIPDVEIYNSYNRAALGDPKNYWRHFVIDDTVYNQHLNFYEFNDLFRKVKKMGVPAQPSKYTLEELFVCFGYYAAMQAFGTLDYKNDQILMEVDTVKYFTIDSLTYNIKYTFKIYNVYNDSYENCYIYTLYKNSRFVRYRMSVPTRNINEIIDYNKKDGKATLNGLLYIDNASINPNENIKSLINDVTGVEQYHYCTEINGIVASPYPASHFRIIGLPIGSNQAYVVKLVSDGVFFEKKSIYESPLNLIASGGYYETANMFSPVNNADDGFYSFEIWDANTNELIEITRDQCIVLVKKK